MKPESELNRRERKSMFRYFATSMARGGYSAPAEAHMSKKSTDKQQNQEERAFSLGRDMPDPAPVDHDAFGAGRVK
jgi:hypothetical protein